MKDKIHPKMRLITVKCACGAEHRIWTTRENIRVDVCSNCHPFYKGDKSVLFVDTEGRVEKFRRKYGEDY